MDEKNRIKKQIEPNIPLYKSLVIMTGSVLALVIALVFPIGEVLFYGFSYIAGKEEKRRRNV